MKLLAVTTVLYPHRCLRAVMLALDFCRFPQDVQDVFWISKFGAEAWLEGINRD